MPGICFDEGRGSEHPTSPTTPAVGLLPDAPRTILPAPDTGRVSHGKEPLVTALGAWQQAASALLRYTPVQRGLAQRFTTPYCKTPAWAKYTHCGSTASPRSYEKRATLGAHSANRSARSAAQERLAGFASQSRRSLRSAAHVGGQ